jgi:hypothetical protein
MAVKKKSETISTLPLIVISVLLAVVVLDMIFIYTVRSGEKKEW